MLLMTPLGRLQHCFSRCFKSFDIGHSIAHWSSKRVKWLRNNNSKVLERIKSLPMFITFSKLVLISRLKNIEISLQLSYEGYLIFACTVNSWSLLKTEGSRHNTPHKSYIV